MKIFFMNDQTSVISPLNMNKVYEAILDLDVPDDCEDIYKGLVGSFTNVTVDKLNQ